MVTDTQSHRMGEILVPLGSWSGKLGIRADIVVAGVISN